MASCKGKTFALLRRGSQLSTNRMCIVTIVCLPRIVYTSTCFFWLLTAPISMFATRKRQKTMLEAKKGVSLVFVYMGSVLETNVFAI